MPPHINEGGRESDILSAFALPLRTAGTWPSGLWGVGLMGLICYRARGLGKTVADVSLALPIIRNMPQFP